MRRFSFLANDEAAEELVSRYENYLKGDDTGYFDVHEMEQIIDYYLAYGRTRDSMKALELGERLHPSNNELNVKRAKVYLATGDNARAYRLLQQLIEGDDDLEVVFLKIEALVNMDRMDEAHELALKLLSDANDDLDQMAIELAFIFMNEMQYQYALKVLKIGERHNPRNVQIYIDMAFCYEQLGDNDSAIASYEKVLDINSFSNEAWFQLGQIYFKQAEYTKALDAYEYALAIREDDMLSQLQKAHTQSQLGLHRDAIESFLSFKGNYPEKWQIWLFVADVYEAMEDFTNALHYNKLSYLGMPENYTALVGITVSQLELEEFDEAIEYARKALEIEPESADAWVYLGEAYFELKNYDEALEAYLEAVSLDPYLPDTLLVIGNIYFDKQQPDIALAFYQKAYEQDKNLEMIELFIAIASCYTGDFEQTEEFLQLAIDKNLDAAKIFDEFCPGVRKQ